MQTIELNGVRRLVMDALGVADAAAAFPASGDAAGERSAARIRCAGERCGADLRRVIARNDAVYLTTAVRCVVLIGLLIEGLDGDLNLREVST